jgi:ribulose-phosphate 3-epimerase
MSFITPAVLPVSKSDLEKKLALLERIPSITRIQIDVVDGRLAAPASWPYVAPKEFQTMLDCGEMLPSLERIEYEVDLMCFDVLDAVKAWLALGASRLTIHTESAADLPKLLSSIRSTFGTVVSLGLALNVEANAALARSCADEITYVQLMGIAKIGRQGEPFDKRVMEKIRTFRRMYPSLPLQVDGGVSLENAKELFSLGVSNLVVGSGILRARDPAASFTALEALKSSFGV